MLRRLIKIAIVLAIAHAGYRAIPVYIRYVQFKDAVTDVARFAGGQSEQQVRGRVANLVDRYRIPVDVTAIPIVVERNKTAIDASYVEPVELLPTYIYTWKFDVNLDVLHARPTSVDQIR